ncbi:MAG: DUF2834 domain-containing protein [Burkholderiaceae bacterium]
MKPVVALLTLTLAAFGALSLYAMAEVGYFGIWQAGLAGPGALQLLADLLIVCTLVMTWMVTDARRHGITVWPFIVITLAAGSFGPLLYLLRRHWAALPARVAA